LVSKPGWSSLQNMVVFLFLCEWYENTFDICSFILISWLWFVCSVEMAGRNDTLIANVMTTMAQVLAQANANAMQGKQNKGVLMSLCWIALLEPPSNI